MAKQKPHKLKNTKGTWTYEVHTSSKEDKTVEETAASLEKEQKEMDLATLSVIKNVNKDKFKRNSRWKTILLSGFSAIFIGSIIGFFLLRMFVQVDTPTNAENTLQEPPIGADIEKEEGSPELITTSLDSLEVYILQAGIFSEQENADALIASLTSLNIQTVFLERDGQYYLMAGVGPTEDTTKTLATELSDNQADLYVKEWSTETKEIEMTEAENDWIIAFQDFFDEQLHQVNLQQPIAAEEIAALVDSVPENTDTINQLVTGLTEMIDEPSFYQLLHWMKVYDEL